MSVVVFDPTAFKTQYPEFSGLDNALLTNSFNMATFACNNTAASIVADLTERTTLLNLLTAHLTKLTYGTNDGVNPPVPPTGAVGRVEVAKEGSVHVRLDMGPPTASGAWYQQTQYGATYWALTVRYRSFRYFPTNRPSGATPFPLTSFNPGWGW